MVMTAYPLPNRHRLSWSAGSEGKKLRGEMEEQVDDNVKEDDKEEEEEEEDYDENLLSVEEEELMERLGELEQEVGSRLTSLARYTKLEMKGVEINEGLARTDRQTDRLYKHLYCKPNIHSCPNNCRMRAGHSYIHPIISLNVVRSDQVCPKT